MFTIEHEFDATVITLVDEGEDGPLLEDIVINAFEDCVTVEQVDPQTDEVMRITLSTTQLRDLAAALNLPEGSYRLERKVP
jgi:hypothetical protein